MLKGPSRSMINSSLVFEDDISQTWVQECSDLRDLERNIQLFEFEEKLKTINIDFEFRVLNRITMTNVHAANMVPVDDFMFGKNRVANYTPFTKTQVLLQPPGCETGAICHSTKKPKGSKEAQRRKSTEALLPLTTEKHKKSLPNVISKMRFEEEESSPQEEVDEQVVYDPSEWYINASFVRHSFCAEMPDSLIITQFPRLSTLRDFFLMLQQKTVRQIVMLCNSNEKEIMEEDCYSLKSPSIVTVAHFTCKTIDLDSSEFLSVKKLVVQSNASEQARWDEFSITQYKFKQWEDFGVIEEKHFPTFFQAIVRIHSEFMKNCEEKVDRWDKRMLVHCRAGIGRSGCFAAIYFIYDYLIYLKALLDSDKSINPREDQRFQLSVFGATRKLRECRWGAVDKPRQYFLIYQFTAYMIKAIFPEVKSDN